MSATTALGALAVIWVGIGLLLAWVMGRHGHDPFAWWLRGTLLGRWPCPWPFPSSAAAEAGRGWCVRAAGTRSGRRPGRSGWLGRGDHRPGRRARPARPSAGPADVGQRGLPGRLGRARPRPGARPGRAGAAGPAGPVAAVDWPARPRRWPAGAALMLVTGHLAGALPRLAAEGGYDLLVVGSRGARR